MRPCDEKAGLLLVDATGTRRRLQALAAAGWPLAVAGKRLGWNRSRVNAAMRQRRVTAATAEKVRRVHDELWDKRYVPSTRGERTAVTATLAHARRMRWACFWNDPDNPEERPKGRRRPPVARVARGNYPATPESLAALDEYIRVLAEALLGRELEAAA